MSEPVLTEKPGPGPVRLLAWGALWSGLGVAAILSGLPGFGPRRGGPAPTAGATARRVDLDQLAEAAQGTRSRGVARPTSLFFPRRDRPHRLLPLTVEIEDDGDQAALAARVVEALARDPGQPGLVAALPPGTRALAVFFEGDRAVVDLSPEAAAAGAAGPAASSGSLHALVNSLTRLPGIARVRILISHQESLSLGEHQDLADDLTDFPGAVDALPED